VKFVLRILVAAALSAVAFVFWTLMLFGSAMCANPGPHTILQQISSCPGSVWVLVLPVVVIGMDVAILVGATRIAVGFLAAAAVSITLGFWVDWP